MSKEKTKLPKSKRRLTLSGRTTIVLFLVVVLPVSFLGILFFRNLSAHLSEDVLCFSESIAKEKNEHLTLFSTNINSLAQGLMMQEGMKPFYDYLNRGDQGELTPHHPSVEKAYQIFLPLIHQQGIQSVLLLRADGNGVELNEVPEAIRLSASWLDQVEQTYGNYKDGDLQWLFYQDQMQFHEGFVAGRKIFVDPDINSEVHLFVIMEQAFLHKLFTGETHYSQYFMIVSQENQIVYHPDDHRIGTTLNPLYLDVMKEQSPLKVHDFDHKLAVASFTRLAPMNWSMISIIPYQTIFDYGNGVLGTFLSLIAFLFFMALLTHFYISRSYLMPITSITQQFINLKAGSFDKVNPLKAKGNNEVADLAKCYNDYLEDLKEKNAIFDKLKQSQEEYYMLVNSIGEILFQCDFQGNILFVNETWRDITGYTAEETKDCSIFDFVHKEDLKPIKNALRQLINNKKDLHQQVRIIRKNKSVCWTEIVAQLVNHENETIISGFIVDISDRRELDTMKDNFINAVCHEIKTPFTAISEGIQILAESFEKDEEPEKLGGIVAVIKRNTFRLQRLIEDLFVYRNVNLERENYVFLVTDLNDVIAPVVKEMSYIAKQKHLDMEFIPHRPLAEASIDKEKMARVLKHLLENAIQYTEKGKITVKTENNKDKVRLTVEDTGIGIDKNDFHKLFVHFSQLSTGLKRRTGGTGMGLVISRRIIEQHQGTIWVESEPNKGSRFIFEIPMETF